MERIPRLSMASSFSALSLAEGSEVISEVDEIHEVKNLHRSGSELFKDSEFGKALKCYNDALEINENSVESLEGRAAVYLELAQPSQAMLDIHKLLVLDRDKPQIHFLHGRALFQLADHHGALLAFLAVFNLDPETEHVDLLTTNIAFLASKFCDVPEALRQNLSKLEPYNKLCEVGACLYQGQQYDLCVRVLSSAQQLETNQQGVTMKLQLTLANAHSKLKHSELAISLYQELLSVAQSAHDPQYQTKALINIASLFLELGDTHKAIVHYEKLLDLQSDLQGEDPSTELPHYWNQDLQCALHLNLSIAYKAIGDIHKALGHAKHYIRVVQGCQSKSQAEAQSHLNIGTLHEILGEYEVALEHFKAYLNISKTKSDKKGIAQAYGCLGSVYSHLGNSKLSCTYHDQHVALAKKLEDKMQLLLALEQAGDSYTVLDQYDKAAESYHLMLQQCTSSQNKTTALCKLGNAHRAQDRFQHSTYYYDQARALADSYGYTSTTVMCEYNLACMMQHSTQGLELDQAEKYFKRLIPLMEAKIQQHQDEDTFCPTQLHSQLRDCYQGIQNVLAKVGSKQDCLEYSEAYKSKHSPESATSPSSPTFQGHMVDMWSVDKMTRVTSQQSAVVLYYTLLPSSVLTWVLVPGQGVVRFHVSRSSKSDQTMEQQIQDMVSELKSNRDTNDLQYTCENRALPVQDTQLELTKKKNKALSQTSKREQVETFNSESANRSEIEPREQKKSVGRRLFNLLVAPVEDILSELESDSSLIIVPDGALYHCPFSIIQDWHGRRMADRFHVTCIPSLHALHRVLEGELDQLRLQDDLDLQRRQARLGGIPKVISQAEYVQMMGKCYDYGCDYNDDEDDETINLRMTSNPRLVTSGSKRSKGQGSGGGSRQVTFLSQTTMSSLRTARRPGGLSTIPSITTGTTTPRTRTGTPRDCATPTSLERALGAHTLCTLTSRTSTDTDITTSNMSITQFQQISNPQKCVVIGCPKLPHTVKLHEKEWRPPGDLKVAQVECLNVAQYCDVDPLVAEQATKDVFLQQLKEATILHIATIGCLKTGVLVMTPNPTQKEVSDLAPEQGYLVTSEEIAQTPLVAKLVVLSGGWSLRDRGYVDEGYKLPGAFLAAGAQCVLTLLWPVTNDALQKFFFHFYAALQPGCLVTTAVAMATKALQDDDRFADISTWCPFVLLGRDTQVDLTQLRHSMLDQRMDRVEGKISAELRTDPLNPETLTPNMASREENLHSLQECVSEILAHHSQPLEVISQLLQLMDSSLKRLHQTNTGLPTQLSEALRQSAPATRLLNLLGFHLQSQGAFVTAPYVIYPHWNPDDLLLPAYDALCALMGQYGVCTDLEENGMDLASSVDTIFFQLCITKHSPEIQLKVCDVSVRPLWRDNKVKALLSQLGFKQIGLLLNFNSVPSTRKLLTAGLQLFIALSCHKSSTLLHKLDVNLLGGPQGTGYKDSAVSADNVRLPSLTPLLLPRNQLRISTPWLSTAERPDEMGEKMKLAKNKSDLASEYRQHLARAKTWHQSSIAPQGNESLAKVGRQRSMPQKVKVMSGGSASQPRVPVNDEAELNPDQTHRRRDHAHFVLQERVSNVALRHRDHVNKLYLPYIQNV